MRKKIKVTSKKTKSKRFDPYGEPTLYQNPPKEFLEQRVGISKINIGNHEDAEIPEGAKRVYISSSYNDWDGTNIEIEFWGESSKIPNPNYQKELKKYNEVKAKYDQELKEWTEQKRVYDSKEKEREIRTLKARLKKLEKE